HVADKLQIVVLLAHHAEERVGDQAVNVGLDPAQPPRVRHRLAEALRQVRMSVRPFHRPAQRLLGGARREVQAFGQRRGLFVGEIAQVYAPTDAERRSLRIADKVAGRGHADEREREAFEFWRGGAGVVEVADRGEEIVGEIQAERGANLVDEDDYRLGDLTKQN